MKYVATIASTLILLTASPASAQTPLGQINLPAYLQGGYAGLKMNLTQAAEKMPSATYGFQPGSMPEVRTFGQLFAHVAEAQFGTCAMLKNVPHPHENRDLEQELHTKAEIVEALAASFVLCDDVFSSFTDANETEFVKQGPREVSKSAAMVGLLAHSSEMYGVSTVYLRLQGLVQPSTEQQTRRRAAAGP